VEHEADTHRALRLAQLTVAYNVVEGVVAVTVGLLAGLVSLVGFGADSGIESASAVLLSLRLAARLRDREIDEHRERRALRLIALTFYALALYVSVEGVRSLLGDEEPDQSVVGVVLLVASIIVMPMLARAKRQIGERLADPLILADAAETRLCALLSISTLAGLLIFAATGQGWVDPVAGFVIAGFAVMEGREAWEGELVDDD
jgi:divalent metal cation (Fe/Co/Zn/Cd) transporter